MTHNLLCRSTVNYLSRSLAAASLANGDRVLQPSTLSSRAMQSVFVYNYSILQQKLQLLTHTHAHHTCTILQIFQVSQCETVTD